MNIVMNEGNGCKLKTAQSWCCMADWKQTRHPLVQCVNNHAHV